MSAVSAPDARERSLASTRHGLPRFDRWLGPLLLAAGVVGCAAAFVLAVEKFRLVENPLYVPACSLGETVNCTSVMRSDQAEAFGFPNPFLGIAGFAVVAASGFVLVRGGRISRTFWLVLQVGLMFAVVFVHWLMFQTLYRIEALCPFCMAVWAVTIPAFWYVTMHIFRDVAQPRARAGTLARALMRNHGVILTVWLLIIAAFVFERFWAPWASVFG